MNTDSNKDVIRVIIWALAFIAVLCVSGLFYLVSQGTTIPTEMWLLSSNVVTALTAMLVKTSPTQTTETSSKPVGDVHLPAQQLEVEAK